MFWSWLPFSQFLVYFSVQRSILCAFILRSFFGVSVFDFMCLMIYSRRDLNDVQLSFAFKSKNETKRECLERCWFNKIGLNENAQQNKLVEMRENKTKNKTENVFRNTFSRKRVLEKVFRETFSGKRFPENVSRKTFSRTRFLENVFRKTFSVLFFVLFSRISTSLFC